MSAFASQKEFKQIRIVITAMFLMFFIGCGGESGGGGNNSGNNNNGGNNNDRTVRISISPTTFSMLVGETRTLSVDAQNTDFTLSVSPISGSGCVKSSNNALACKPTSEGEYRVTVTATADTSKQVTARIRVTDPEMLGDNFEEIYTPIELYTKIMNNLSGNFRLMADISLEIYDNWLPIGTSSVPFTGKINGNGYKITNLNIVRITTYVGLFGYVRNGTIANLALEDVSIVGGSYTGAIAGYTYNTTITNSYSKGNIYATGYAGGIAGYVTNSRFGANTVNNSAIIGCYSTGDISSSSTAGGIAGDIYDSTITNNYSTGDVFGSFRAGGIAGYVGSSDSTIYGITTITNSYSTGDIYGQYAGGIAGYVTDINTTINNSYSTGDVSATDSIYYYPAYAGGIAGYVTGSTITNSYSTGDIYATVSSDSSLASVYAGGVAGYVSNSPITNNYSIGNVFATANVSLNNAFAYSYAGGIAGYAMTYIPITNCYSIGDISATSTASDSSRAYAYAGGIAGDVSSSTITNCAAINRAINSTLYAGRIVGYISEGTVPIYNNFALNIMTVLGSSYQLSAGRGVNRTDAQLKTQSTYSDTIVGDGVGGLGWKFGNNVDNPWKMPDGGGYPILYWQ